MLNIQKKYLFLIAIFGFIFSFYFFDIDSYFTLEYIQKNHLLIEEYTHTYPITALIIINSIYLILLSFFIPASVAIYILSGFLFHPILSIILTTITATLGGLVNFFTIKKTFNLRHNKKINNLARPLENGFKNNELLYLILLRLIPSPYILQNTITVFFRVKIRNFIFGTIMGILPWATIYCTLGSGLHDLIETTENLNFNDLITLKIMLPIFALILLILISLFLKRTFLFGKK